MKNPSFPGSQWSGTFTQTSLEKLEQARRRERRHLQRLEDVQALSMMALDALTFMLVLEVVLLPLAFVALADLVYIGLYAGSLTLVAFGAFYSLYLWLEHRVTEHRTLVRVVEAELADLRKVRKGIK